MMFKKWMVIFLLCFWVVSASATVCGPYVCQERGYFSKNSCEMQADGVVTGVIGQMKNISSSTSGYDIDSTSFVLTVSTWQKKPKDIFIPKEILFQNDNCLSPRIKAKDSDSIRVYFKTAEHDGVRHYWLIDHQVLPNH